MRRTTGRAVALGATGLVLAALAAAQTGDTPATLESVQRCVADNAPARTMRQRIELRTEDRMGEGRRYDVKGEWKKGDDGLSKLIMRVSAPADLRGSAFLMIEREGREPDLFSYLPELEKVRRINMRSATGSLFGSDFSYEDMQRLQSVAGASSSVLLGEAEQEGRAAWQVETRPAPESGSAYTRIVAWVDQERCVPLRMEFYERDDAPAKVLTAPPAEVVREGAGWVPTELRLENVAQGTRTLLSVEDVELDVELPDKDFSQTALRRRR
jgi:outer membrane lipoprotein-sorting protein